MKNTIKYIGVSLLTGLAINSTVSAQNLITNGDFESGVAGWSNPVNNGFGTFFDKVFNNIWATSGVGGESPWMADEGITGLPSGKGFRGGVVQNADKTHQTVTTVVGQTYNLTGLIVNPEPPQFVTNAGFASYFVDGVAISGSTDVNGLHIGVLESEWEITDYTFIATSTSTQIGFGLIDWDYASNGTQITSSYIVADNISLTAVAVPEPSSTLLLGLGALGMIARRKRA